ncbi:uncharacterized protein [Procambarus clarkii]|uniref:uncharacterized protein isoform X3 n=1 Tax=Procambarus clarkii TaxID=6728 RepID=UPI0037421490
MDWRRLLPLLPLLLSGGEVGPRGVRGLSCITPLQSSGMTQTQMDKTLWLCSGRLWSTGDVVYQTQCGPGQLEDNVSCGSVSVGVCSSPSTPPPNTTTTTIVDNAAYYYQCVAPLVWLSGEPDRLSQCLLRQWSNVYDVCDEDCPMPRDCSTVADMGFNTSDVYNIVPSGLPRGPVARVYCSLSSDTSDTGWTQVLYNSNGFTNTYVSEPSDISSMTQPYFLRIEKLSALNWNGTTPRPLVFWFNITLTNDKSYFAIYSGVQMAQNNPWTLTAVGDYHGTAGDSFSGNLNQKFQDLWWQERSGVNSSQLIPSPMTWDSLTKDTSQTIRSVALFVRPQDYDADHSCPPEVAMAPWWRNINITFPIVRSAGTVISYQCVGELIMAGNSTTMAERVTEDSTTCVALTNGTLVWNTSIISPPCRLTCPDNYVKTVDGTSCARFSDDDATYGIVTASLRCRDELASLALLTEYGNHPNIVNNQYYYTAHVRDSLTPFQPPSPSGMNVPCAPNETCQLSGRNECYTVGQAAPITLQGRAQSCFLNTTRYICRRPAFCPNNYSQYKGLCYNVLDTATYTGVYINRTGDHIEALKHCMADGSSLAYPESLDVLQYLESLVRQKALNSVNIQTSLQETKIAIIGLNQRNNWTGSGVYAPDPDVVALANITPVEGYKQRYLTVNANPAQGYNLTNALLTDETVHVHYVICQRYGLYECLDDLPPPTENMTLTWDGDTHVGNTVFYRCYPGYFVMGKVPMVEQKWWCQGFLGGWMNGNEPSVLQNCSAVDVCNETSIGPVSPLITNVTSPTHLQLNGTINFTCPSNMSTQQGDTHQRLTCSQTTSGYSFSPALDPCNVCAGRPVVENATINWGSSQYKVTTNVVVATCKSGYYLNITTTTQTLTCGLTGWSDATPCYEGCGAPPPAGHNMTMGAFTSNTIGSTLYYNCSEGLLVPETFPDVKDHLVLTCQARVWTPSGQPLSCAKLCLGEPPTLDLPGTSTWDNTTRTAGTKMRPQVPPSRLARYIMVHRHPTGRGTSSTTPARGTSRPPPATTSPPSLSTALTGSWRILASRVSMCAEVTRPPSCPLETPPGTANPAPLAHRLNWRVLIPTCFPTLIHQRTPRVNMTPKTGPSSTPAPLSAG